MKDSGYENESSILECCWKMINNESKGS